VTTVPSGADHLESLEIAIALLLGYRFRSHTLPIMKPIIGATNAWTWFASPASPLPHLDTALGPTLTDLWRANSTVLSIFGIIILSVIGGLYRSGHEEFGGSTSDPEDGKAVAGTVFTAVIIYAVHAAPIYPVNRRILTFALRCSWCSAAARASSTSARTEGARLLCETTFLALEAPTDEATQE
jgi:hypothetical protein